MKEVIKILESHPLFRSVSSRSIEGLAARAKLARYNKGEVVYNAGSIGHSVHIVLEGLCETVPADASEEALTFTMGAFFGESSALEDKPRTNTVKAIADTLLLQVSSESLRTIITHNEKLAALFKGQQHNPCLYFDTGEKAFRPVQRNLITFVDFADASNFQEPLTQIGRFLNRETGEPILILEFCTQGGEMDLTDLCEKVTQLSAHLDSSDPTYPYLHLKISLGSDERALPHLRPFLECGSRQFTYILTYLPGQPMGQTAETFIQLSNNLYPVLDAGGTSTYQTKHFIQLCAMLGTPKPRPLLFCKPAEASEQVRHVGQKIGRPVHALLRSSPQDLNIPAQTDTDFERTRRFEAQFRRLAREIGQCRIGLALSSGGAKGLAHIGVIQVLEEHGIEIDYLAGSSMGAYVATCWARGYSGEGLAQIAMRNSKPISLIDPMIPPRLGAIKGHKVRRRLEAIHQQIQFEDLSMPVGVVATSLRTLEPVIFESGSVVDGVMASCSIPGICQPYAIDEERYVDGGLTDPLPIDVLERWGVEHIIAVSTIPSPDDYRTFHAARRAAPRPHRSWGKRLLSSIHKQVNYFAKGNVFDTLMRSIESSQIRIVERELFRADVAIQAVDCQAQWHDFVHPRTHIERGRIAAEQQLELIQSLAFRKASSV